MSGGFVKAGVTDAVSFDILLKYYVNQLWLYKILLIALALSIILTALIADKILLINIELQLNHSISIIEGL